MTPQIAAEQMMDRLASTAEYALQRELLDRHERRGYQADLRLRPLHNRLIELGWVVQTHTNGSVYYTKGGERVRLSNHEVPSTAEREHAASSGGWTWHRHGWQIITAFGDSDKCFAEIAAIEEAIAEDA